MTFRLFVCLLLASFNLNASDTGLLGGDYSLSFTALDADERYPVRLQMKVSDTGEIRWANIHYPSYHCQAEKGSVSLQAGGFVLNEKVTKGKEICLPSAYKFIVQPLADYSKPESRIFTKVLNLTGDQEVATVISDIAFKPTKTTGFLLVSNFASWQEMRAKASTGQLKEFTVKVPKSEFYGQAVELIYRDAEKRQDIGLYEDFLRRYRLEPYKSTASKNLAELYRQQNTQLAFLKAYRLSREKQDIVASLNLAASAERLEEFLQEYSEIEQIAGIQVIKLEAYRRHHSFYGYLKAFGLSDNKQDIKKAFDLAQTKSQENQAEKDLGKFLSELNASSKECLNGNISPQMLESHRTLATVCDTPKREERISAICFAVSFGGCDYIASKAVPNPLLQTITAKECRKQIAQMTTEDRELADLGFLLATDGVAIGRKQFLNSNPLVQYFLGLPFAVTEVITRAGAISECVVKTRTKCAKLYEVCR